MQLSLQPLRIPPGWQVEWNTFWELDPSPETIAHFTGSSLLLLTNPRARYAIDLEWRPEEDVNGIYRLRLLTAAWILTPTGRRDKRAPLRFDWDRPLCSVETRSRGEVVERIEAWMRQHLTPRNEVASA
jgi:hypothetical protein